MKRTKTTLIGAALFLIYILLYSWWMSPSPAQSTTNPYIDEAEKVELLKRFRYHGITSCECIGDKCWFIRDGKRCRL